MVTTTVSSGALALVPLLAALCPPFPEESTVVGDITYGDPTLEAYAVQDEGLWAVVNAKAPLDDGGPAANQDPAVVGAWEWARPWDVTAIHAAVLPTGKVLQYSYPAGGSDGSRARLWDPATGAFTNVDWGPDLFCGGLSHLPDGRLYVTGGNNYECEAQGRRDTNVFHPATMQWTRLQDMYDGRWYPSNYTLPDGRVLITSGQNSQCELNADLEVYDPARGDLQFVEDSHRYLQLYPRMHVLSDGRLAHVGPEQATFTFDFDNGWRFVTSSRMGFRREGASVLIPGRTDQVMIIGGAFNDFISRSCEIIDFGAPVPVWSYTTPLHHARWTVEALVLPDKTVMVLGGGTDGLYGEPVKIPELFDPETETWTELAPHFYGRMYHSTTVLLPDGRVLTAGQDDGPSSRIGELYSPPYLFRGPRPVIEAAPGRAAYGRWFDIATPEASSIESVVLVKLSSVTHSVHFDQRLVDLEFGATGAETLRARIPANPAEAPPGYYMLFILSPEGVPSVSTMVRVEPWTVGDVDGDAVVDLADLLAILSTWGACEDVEDCPADLNGDGEVDLDDVLIVLSNWS